MEEQILKKGIGAECKINIGGDLFDAKIVMINTWSKEVGVVVRPDNFYFEKPYRYIKF